MIKAIIFDCFGVLTTDNWKEFVAALPENDRQTARDLNRAHDAGMISKAEFLEKVHSLSGRSTEEIDQILYPGKIVKNTDLFRFIESQKPKYKIGILSNVGTNWIRESFLSAEDRQLFDDILLSYDVGLTKPDPEIFRLAAGRLGVELNECVLVDDMEFYGEKARELGMKYVVYKDFPQARNELETVLADAEA
jgi:HAD superfamily hydrolase (TIGR01493 family)